AATTPKPGSRSRSILFWGRAGMMMVAATSLLQLPLDARDQKPTGSAPAADLKSRYEFERAEAEKAGILARFSPELLERADQGARRGAAALAAKHLASARDFYRDARWQLPSVPDDFP